MSTMTKERYSLNAVADFNPYDYKKPVRDYATKEVKKSESGEPEGYFIPAAALICWFRLIYPKGKIEVKPVSIENGSFVFRARVYADKNDENFISEAYARKNDFPDGEFDSFETVQTKAVQKALVLGGFGVEQNMCLFNEDGTAPGTPFSASNKIEAETTFEEFLASSKEGTSAPASEPAPAPEIKSNDENEPIKGQINIDEFDNLFPVQSQEEYEKRGPSPESIEEVIEEAPEEFEAYSAIFNLKEGINYPPFEKYCGITVGKFVEAKKGLVDKILKSEVIAKLTDETVEALKFYSNCSTK